MTGGYNAVPTNGVQTAGPDKSQQDRRSPRCLIAAEAPGRSRGYLSTLVTRHDHHRVQAPPRGTTHLTQMTNAPIGVRRGQGALTRLGCRRLVVIRDTATKEDGLALLSEHGGRYG